MMKKNLLQKVAIITVLVATVALLVTSLVYVYEHWVDLEYVGSTATMIDNFYKGEAHLGWSSTVFSSSYEAYNFYFTMWDDINNANDMILFTSLVAFLLTIILLVAGNFGRRKYYISNLVTGLLLPCVTIVMAIITITKCVQVQDDFAYVATDIQYYLERKSLDYQIPSSWGIWAIVYSVIYIVIMLGFACVTVYKFVTTYPKFNKKEIELENDEAKLADLNKVDSKEVVANE